MKATEPQNVVVAEAVLAFYQTFQSKMSQNYSQEDVLISNCTHDQHQQLNGT